MRHRICGGKNIRKRQWFLAGAGLLAMVAGSLGGPAPVQEWWKPYGPNQTERENVFAFMEPPTVKLVGPDRYEISFAVKGYCDVTVAIVNPDPAKELVKGRGTVVRHLASGVLGKNAPEPFQKNSLKQTIYWDGKDDLEWYPKESEKLQVRVMLGLKPEFDKRLGGTSPYNIPGTRIYGLAADPSGVYVAASGHRARLYLRHFDRDVRYVKSLSSPAANMPRERLTGMGYVEYEPGRHAVHAPDVNQTVADHQRYLPFVGRAVDNQPAITAGRIFFVNDGKYTPSKMFSIHMDGATDLGVQGYDFTPGGVHNSSRLVASLDEKWIYVTEDGSPTPVANRHHVLRMPVGGPGPATLFFGVTGKPGSDARHLNQPRGLDTDAAGRLYVCDYSNNRIQVIDPQGELLHSVPIDRPHLIAVHKKTGAIYVQHDDRVKGTTVRRTVKLASLENPKPVAHLDGPRGLMALDSWSPRPRLWFAGADSGMGGGMVGATGHHNVTVWEEKDGAFVKIADFDELARQADGASYAGRWPGGALGMRMACAATRERVYADNGGRIFDLRTGAHEGSVHIRARYDDIVFDKRGYLHVHLNPGFDHPGVIRLDPGQARQPNAQSTDQRMTDAVRYAFSYPEIPYDYGVEIKSWTGGLPTRCQPGAKYFQDGVGVNMRGDVVVQSNIYHVPRMEAVGHSAGWGAMEARQAWDPERSGGREQSYAQYQRWTQDQEKEGVQVYSIRRQPGIPLAGATAWIFNANGELQKEVFVVAGYLMAGVQIDNDFSVYFSAGRTKAVGGDSTPFLSGRGGTLGVPDDKANRNPFTGTLVKTRPDESPRILVNDAPIPLDPLPDRAPDMVHGRTSLWLEGHEWLYAGASPLVPGSCSCPTHRAHLDWYRRTFVPQAYRHAIGVVDTAGNLVMHIGQYGNFDSVNGPNSRIPVGGDGIAMSAVRFISGTDNYLVFDDHGEGITVLKLAYHAEQSVEIR